MASYNITKESAIHMAKWLVKQEADDPRTGMMRKIGLNTALNGGIEEIFNKVYDELGFSISAREDNPTHQQWLQNGSLIKE